MKYSPHPVQLPSSLDTWDGDFDPILDLDRVKLSGTDLMQCRQINADMCVLENCVAMSMTLDALALTDVRCTRLEAAALRSHKANVLRVEISDSRFTGAEFAEAQIEDCVFKNVKFDEAGFRFAHLKRVVFENCILKRADFSSAHLSGVTFRGCDLEGANFVSAQCSNVDVTTEDLTGCKGILGLKGATISEAQLMQLAPLFAAELGFHVTD